MYLWRGTHSKHYSFLEAYIGFPLVKDLPFPITTTYKTYDRTYPGVLLLGPCLEGFEGFEDEGGFRDKSQGLGGKAQNC